MAQFFIGNSTINAIDPTKNNPNPAVSPLSAGFFVDSTPGSFVSTTVTGAPSISLQTSAIGGSGSWNLGRNRQPRLMRYGPIVIHM